jgi:hypothetical protein
MEARFSLQTWDAAKTSRVAIALAERGARATQQDLAVPSAVPHPVECAFVRVLELRVSLAGLGIAPGGGLRFQCSLWQGGLPIDAVPAQGWLEMRATDPAQWGG